MEDIKAFLNLKIRDSSEILQDSKEQLLINLEKADVSSKEKALEFVKDNLLYNVVSNRDIVSITSKKDQDNKQVSLFSYFKKKFDINDILFYCLFFSLSISYIIFVVVNIFITTSPFFLLILFFTIYLLLFFLYVKSKMIEIEVTFDKLSSIVKKSKNIPNSEKEVAINIIKNYYLDSYSHFLSKLVDLGVYSKFKSKEEMEEVYFEFKYPVTYTIAEITENNKSTNEDEKKEIASILEYSSTFESFLRQLSDNNLSEKFNQNELNNIQAAFESNK